MVLARELSTRHRADEHRLHLLDVRVRVRPAANSRILGAHFCTGAAKAPIIATSRISQPPVSQRRLRHVAAPRKHPRNFRSAGYKQPQSRLPLPALETAYGANQSGVYDISRTSQRQPSVSLGVIAREGSTSLTRCALGARSPGTRVDGARHGSGGPRIASVGRDRGARGGVVAGRPISAEAVPHGAARASKPAQTARRKRRRSTAAAVQSGGDRTVTRNTASSGAAAARPASESERRPPCPIS